VQADAMRSVEISSIALGGAAAPSGVGTHVSAPRRRAAAPRRLARAQASAGDENAQARASGASAGALAAAAAAAAAVVATAPPAVAGEWRARRHHRRLDAAGEAPVRPLPAPRPTLAAQQEQQRLAAAAAAAPPSDLVRAAADARRAAEGALRRVRRAVEGDAAYSVGVSGRSADARRGEYSGYYGSGADAAGGLGWAGAAAAAVALLLVATGRIRLPSWTRARRGGARGRWIRDRSLGGKMVFVPDDAAGGAGPRPLWGADDDVPASPAAVTAAASGAAAASAAAAAADPNAMPEWWAPPAPVRYGVGAARKEELAAAARRALRALEDAKVLRGEDYSTEGLERLLAVCLEGGGLAVRPSTESGRDALLRAGVRAALAAALASRAGPAAARSGGLAPGRFVAGLAEALGVPPRRAVTIAHAEVAAAARQALIDAEAAYRSNSEEGVGRALHALYTPLATLRMPVGAAEAEAVGRSVRQATTLEFRKAVFLAAGAADVGLAPLVAEALGFDAALVMPALLAEMAAAGGGGASAA
jgi:hypothetical protein